VGFSLVLRSGKVFEEDEKFEAPRNLRVVGLDLNIEGRSEK
jgi:hypothetical protein